MRALASLIAWLLSVLITYALIVETLAGETSWYVLIAIALLWLPLLALVKGRCRRPLVYLAVVVAAYFLPRLITLFPSAFVALMNVDALISNAIFEALHFPAKIVVTDDKALLYLGGKARMTFEYLVGCSSLRAIPFTLALIWAAKGSLKEKLLATLISVPLIYPLNAIRLFIILYTVEAFSWNPVVAHATLSPLISTVEYLFLLILIGYLVPDVLDEIEVGMECFFDLLKPKRR